MKYPIFKVEFLLEKTIVERRKMAHSIRLEKLYHITQLKSFPFFVCDYFKVRDEPLGVLKIIKRNCLHIKKDEKKLSPIKYWKKKIVRTKISHWEFQHNKNFHIRK